MSDSFATPWAMVCQAPLSMGFSKQEYWSGLPFPSPQKHCTMMKGSAHQGYIILSKFTPTIRASKYMKQNLVELKGEIDKATVRLITSQSHSQQLRFCATDSRAVEVTEACTRIQQWLPHTQKHMTNTGSYAAVQNGLSQGRSAHLRISQFLKELLLISIIYLLIYIYVCVI